MSITSKNKEKCTVKRITLSAALCGENATPAVAEALRELCKTGGTLCFERGEYHFRTEGAGR